MNLFLFFSEHYRFFCRLVCKTKRHYENIFYLYAIKNLFFTDSNEPCQRYSYNLDEGKNSIWMKTTKHPECIGLRISNRVHIMRNYIYATTIKFTVPTLYRKSFVFEWNSLHICPSKWWLYHSHEFRKPSNEDTQITTPF